MARYLWIHPSLFVILTEESYLFCRVQTSHSVLWNAMMLPLTNMTIYGVIWYQGMYIRGTSNKVVFLYLYIVNHFVFKLWWKLLRTKWNSWKKTFSFTCKTFYFERMFRLHQQNEQSHLTWNKMNTRNQYGIGQIRIHS